MHWSAHYLFYLRSTNTSRQILFQPFIDAPTSCTLVKSEKINLAFFQSIADYPFLIAITCIMQCRSAIPINIVFCISK